MEHLPGGPSTVPAEVQVSCFRGQSGVSEYHLLVRPADYASFEIQLDSVAAAYRAALAQHGLAEGTACFRRFFCSDLANQASVLGCRPLASRHAPDEPCAVSWVQQAPTHPAKLALWAYHVCDPAGALDKRLDGSTLECARHGRMHCWTTGISDALGRTAPAQTRRVLQQYVRLLRARRLSLARDVVRTWLFVTDIDVNYAGVVAARRAFFAAHGLTPETHFIASTGIAGAGADPAARVTLDAHAIGGLRPGQVAFLSAPEHLSPTHVYGVTFERATQVTYADRAHIFLSGTASIDSAGRILHAGDVSRQLDRALENMDALLHQAGAARSDLRVLIAYVRDPADEALVRARLRERCGAVPSAVLAAAICRPGWLVEIEGQAIRTVTRPELPAF